MTLPSFLVLFMLYTEHKYINIFKINIFKFIMKIIFDVLFDLIIPSTCAFFWNFIKTSFVWNIPSFVWLPKSYYNAILWCFYLFSTLFLFRRSINFLFQFHLHKKKIFPNEFGVKKHPLFFLDFLCQCFKKEKNDESGKLVKKRFCPIFKKNRETLLYNNPNHSSIELSQESLNIVIQQPETKKNYDSCSSAVYAENMESKKNQKVLIFLFFLF